MSRRILALAGLALALSSIPAAADPLVIGETFTVKSDILGETRHINVFVPTKWGEPIDGALPVLYMPDGGLNEDFLHIAGLLQVSVSNGTMRPFILVGIQNTERARDMTGPTSDPRDHSVAPNIGKSDRFRAFLRDELFPVIGKRYRVTDERALIGESLAGLFVVETLIHHPAMFDSYIAVDPSLWWNDNALPKAAAKILSGVTGKQLFVATGQEAGRYQPFRPFIDALKAQDPARLDWHYVHMPTETHATLYHPAAVKAFRALFAPKQPPQK